MTAEIVHILHHGVSFCRKPGVPGSWEKGHLWIGLGDPDRERAANCPECLAAFAGKPAIIGLSALGRSVTEFIPGTKVVECELCTGPTLFAPSSLQRPEASKAIFVCMSCAVGLGGEIQPMTEEQKRELTANGVDAEIATRFVNTLVRATKAK